MTTVTLFMGDEILALAYLAPNFSRQMSRNDHNFCFTGGYMYYRIHSFTVLQFSHKKPR